jgi:hypothetical protein
MAVLWTIRARRNLRHALAESLCREKEQTMSGSGGPCAGVVDSMIERLGEILVVTFDQQSVVIKDQMLGYRRKGDTFVLLVEVFGEQGAKWLGPYVVKIGPPEDMEAEAKSWESCRPHGLRNDLVFLDLHRGETDTQYTPALMSIVYGDAHQFLGVAVTSPFETAALETVRSGFPRLDSVCNVLVELFERIGFLLYSQAFVDDPKRDRYEFDSPIAAKLDEAMECWTTDLSCRTARDDVNTLAKSGSGQFFDPVDYLLYVQCFVPWQIRRNGTLAIRPANAEGESETTADIPRPSIGDLVPRMLRGCSHGDLHGRNILVGIVRQRMMWPTVFDYEDMSPCNLIGWDFVKLETEFKIRAYLDVFHGLAIADFIRHIQKFEIGLNEKTEECHIGGNWPETQDAKSSEDRLRTILLMIRRMAAEQLGESHGRPNEWLEEYYFLLTCYGVCTGRYQNLQARERQGAILSAGVATTRLTWPRRVQ